MSTEERFNELYQKLLNEKNEIEELKEKAKKESIVKLIIISILCVIEIFVVYWTINNLLFLGTYLFCVIIIILPILAMIMVEKIASKHIENFKKSFKEKIIGTLIKSFGEEINYIPEKGLTEKDYYEGDYVIFSRYKSEDLLYGVLENKCRFAMSDILVQKSDDDDYTTLFAGLFAKIETPKPFNACVRIKRSSMSTVWNNYIEKIDLDSSEFENYFDVFTDDKIIAMQLLTADVMEDLINLAKEAHSEFDITIKNSCIYLRFRTVDMFEAESLEKETLNKKSLYYYYRVLDFCFNLSNKIVDLINKTKYN